MKTRGICCVGKWLTTTFYNGIAGHRGRRRGCKKCRSSVPTLCQSDGSYSSQHGTTTIKKPSKWVISYLIHRLEGGLDVCFSCGCDRCVPWWLMMAERLTPSWFPPDSLSKSELVRAPMTMTRTGERYVMEKVKGLKRPFVRLYRQK